MKAGFNSCSRFQLTNFSKFFSWPSFTIQKQWIVMNLLLNLYVLMVCNVHDVYCFKSSHLFCESFGNKADIEIKIQEIQKAKTFHVLKWYKFIESFSNFCHKNSFFFCLKYLKNNDLVFVCRQKWQIIVTFLFIQYH